MTARTLFLAARATCLLLAFSALAGCILVRTTEHRVKLNANGSGEAVLRLVDIRSDGANDAAVLHDFGTMMQKLEEDGMKEFESGGRKVTGRHFEVHGDTLLAEIAYTFSSVAAVEGLRVQDGDLYLIVAPSREVVKTNGDTDTGERSTRITWPKDATRLSFVIKEKMLPPSTSLAGLYKKYAHL